jgi:sporulation protein YabP
MLEKMYREMDDKKPMRVRQHTIMIDNRERVVITGVQDVDSFNEVEVVLMTDVGILSILGQDLHIAKLSLDEGQLVIEGMIAAADYNDAQPAQKGGGGLMSRFFR